MIRKVPRRFGQPPGRRRLSFCPEAATQAARLVRTETRLPSRVRAYGGRALREPTFLDLMRCETSQNWGMLVSHCVYELWPSGFAPKTDGTAFAWRGRGASERGQR